MAATKSHSKKKQSKTGFVLSLPFDMPASQVVSKAKAAGLVLGEGYVHNIRSAARKKSGKPAPKAVAKQSAKAPVKAAKTPAKKRGRPVGSGKGGTSVSDFVRAQPRSMSAAEVVAAAKKAGLSLQAAYVYKVRGRSVKPEAAKQGGAKKAAAAATKAKAASNASVVRGGTAQETDFRRMVVSLGVGRAEKLLGEVKRRLESIVSGG